jgi:beta-glucosidase
MTRGKDYLIEVEHIRFGDGISVRFGWVLPGTDTATAASNLEMAVAAAREADAALVFAGLNHRFDTEGSDRRDLKLPDRQDELIEAVAAANPNTGVFMVSGSPVEMPWLDKVKAVVQAWYTGMEAGSVMADVAFGEVNPSGKLPFTFPKKLEDTPVSVFGEYQADREEYREGLLVGYRYYDTRKVEPMFPFGHGLSYTTFEYSGLAVERGGQEGAQARVSVTIKNTGNTAGAEVVQLYLAGPECSVPRPAKELKGFAKISLEPGAEEQVTLELTEQDLSFYDPDAHAWKAEPGEYKVLVGSSSRDIRVEGSFEYNG